MIPQEAIDAAKPGDTIRYHLRGPATKDELTETKTELERVYPHLHFEVYAEAAVSSAEIVSGSNG